MNSLDVVIPATGTMSTGRSGFSGPSLNRLIGLVGYPVTWLFAAVMAFNYIERSSFGPAILITETVLVIPLWCVRFPTPGGAGKLAGVAGLRAFLTLLAVKQGAALLLGRPSPILPSLVISGCLFLAGLAALPREREKTRSERSWPGMILFLLVILALPM